MVPKEASMNEERLRMQATAPFQEQSLPTTLCPTHHLTQLVHDVLFLIFYWPPCILVCNFKFLVKNKMTKGASQHFVPRQIYLGYGKENKYVICLEVMCSKFYTSDSHHQLHIWDFTINARDCIKLTPLSNFGEQHFRRFQNFVTKFNFI